MTGQSSTSSLNSSSSSSGGEDSMSDDDTLTEKKAAERLPLVAKREAVRFGQLFPAMAEVYGGAIALPDAKDMLRFGFVEFCF